MFVSVVIPTIRRLEHLIKCLDLLQNQAYPDYEIIIVDQTPYSDSRLDEMISKSNGRIKYFRLKK